MILEPREQMERGATWSAFHMRETLTRRWDLSRPIGLFIGCNPGDADANNDDATSRKYVGFARRWGWGGYVAGNLFQWKATSQTVLASAILGGAEVNPFKPDEWIKRFAPGTPICCAWGNSPPMISYQWARRIGELRATLAPYALLCAGRTRSGSPVHLSRFGYTDAPFEFRL